MVLPAFVVRRRTPLIALTDSKVSTNTFVQLLELFASDGIAIARVHRVRMTHHEIDVANHSGSGGFHAHNAGV